MRKKEILLFIISLLVLILIKSVVSYESIDCWRDDGTDQSICEASWLCSWDSFGNWCHEKGCWDFTTQTDCNAAQNLSCRWESNQAGGWCEEEGTPFGAIILLIILLIIIAVIIWKKGGILKKPEPQL